MAKNGVFGQKMAFWWVVGWNEKMSQIKNPYHTISSYMKWTYESMNFFFVFGPCWPKMAFFGQKMAFWGVIGWNKKMSQIKNPYHTISL